VRSKQQTAHKEGGHTESRSEVDGPGCCPPTSPPIKPNIAYPLLVAFNKP